VISGQAKVSRMYFSKLNLRGLPLMFAVAVSFNPKLIKKVDQCAEVKDKTAPSVFVIKQWHLTPGANTHTGPKVVLPQAENQKQIYQQLGDWESHHEASAILAEGCEGEVNAEMKEVFQGWSFHDLESEYKMHPKDFSGVLAHPVVMTKVSHPEARVFCGDNLSEIKKSQLALSDARADVGYLTRLNEKKDQPELLKPYLNDVIDLYHLKKDATIADAQKALVSDLKATLTIFQSSTHLRDQSFVNEALKLSQAKESAQKPVVIVIGGLHASDLKADLEAKQLNCTVFEPLAYHNDEEALAARLKELTQ
jgi:hypothetical protein